MTTHYDDEIPQYRDDKPDERLYPGLTNRMESMELQQKFREERIKRICEKYKCTQEDACRFIDYRDEGHGVYQAAVMAGLSDPDS